MQPEVETCIMLVFCVFMNYFMHWSDNHVQYPTLQTDKNTSGGIMSYILLCCCVYLFVCHLGLEWW